MGLKTWVELTPPRPGQLQGEEGEDLFESSLQSSKISPQAIQCRIPDYMSAFFDISDKKAACIVWLEMNPDRPHDTTKHSTVGPVTKQHLTKSIRLLIVFPALFSSIFCIYFFLAIKGSISTQRIFKFVSDSPHLVNILKYLTKFLYFSSFWKRKQMYTLTQKT